MSEPLAKKVLLIGWDAADWKSINPLLDQGLMPTLLLRDPRGAAGNVQNFLQRALDVEAMARQVDPSLYRQRTQEAGTERPGRA